MAETRGGKYIRDMTEVEINEVKQAIKADIPFRVIYGDLKYIVPGALLIELLTEIAHLKEALELCKEGEQSQS